MADIEEVDFSGFNTKPEGRDVAPKQGGVVIEGDISPISRKKRIIYILIIISLVISTFIMWRYFYFVPVPPLNQNSLPANIPLPTNWPL